MTLQFWGKLFKGIFVESRDSMRTEDGVLSSSQFFDSMTRHFNFLLLLPLLLFWNGFRVTVHCQHSFSISMLQVYFLLVRCINTKKVAGVPSCSSVNNFGINGWCYSFHFLTHVTLSGKDGFFSFLKVSCQELKNKLTCKIKKAL